MRRLTLHPETLAAIISDLDLTAKESHTMSVNGLAEAEAKVIAFRVKLSKGKLTEEDAYGHTGYDSMIYDVDLTDGLINKLYCHYEANPILVEEDEEDEGQISLNDIIDFREKRLVMKAFPTFAKEITAQERTTIELTYQALMKLASQIAFDLADLKDFNLTKAEVNQIKFAFKLTEDE